MLKSRSLVSVVFAAALMIPPAQLTAGEEKSGMIDCQMKFTLKGWSAFYKTASGKGSVTCSNGQKAEVTLSVKGGGITFGKSSIDEGDGRFSDLKDIEEIFGGYAAAEAHAGAGTSKQASVYTKGEVSLAITGTGRGVNVGFDFGKLTIEKVEAAK